MEELHLLQKWLQILEIPVTTTDLPSLTELPSMALAAICDSVSNFKKNLNMSEESLSLMKLFMLLDSVTSVFKDSTLVCNFIL